MLTTVHLLIAAHIAQWLVTGTTLSPVEPSEAMELAKHGVVNTGLVFFVIVIGLTAVFGRFFCGWGCHLVALQDLSRWLLIKMGFTPRPLRSRILSLVPLAAFVYMFLWPAIFKLLAGSPFEPLTLSFVTTDFWVTFPGLAVAVATFAVCGFAVVFVLGSKGYCTYGCPYGAAFGAADRLAPIRVRVTDDCAGCATCTSVCTSNVRVHREVGDHGMVVDPGCMKCLDCVSSCPNEALYVGLGRPAFGRGEVGDRPAGGLTRTGEIVAGVVFVAAFFVFRGLYGLVPFLFALGLAAIAAGLAVTALRLRVLPDVRLGSIPLKAAGRLAPSGAAILGATAVMTGIWAHGAALQIIERQSRDLFEATAELREAALQLGPGPALGASGGVELIARAESIEVWRDRLSPGVPVDGEYRRAWFAALDGRMGAARELVDGALRRRPDDARAHLLAARLLAAGGRWDEAATAYARVEELDPKSPVAVLGLGMMLGRSGRVEEALAAFNRGLAVDPGSVDLRYNQGLSFALTGRGAEAIAAFEAVLVADPDHLPARENLAGMLAASGRFDEAVVVFDEAIRRSPRDPELRIMAARACLGAGDRAGAAAHVEAAIDLDPSFAPARRLLD